MCEPKFTFHPMDEKKFQSFENKDIQDNLIKWSMKGRIKAQTFRFDQQFQTYNKDDFVKAFFEDQNVIHHLQTLSSSGKWCPIGIPASRTEVEQLPCSILSMDFFDRLEENGIIRESGRIMKCLDEYVGDFTVADELRKMLLMDDSDNYDIYSDSEREEFLFRLFKHVCLGGQVCQYEDEVKPYLETTKLIYKDMISVVKDQSSGELSILSSVYKIAAYDKGDEKFYPSDREHEQDFAYLIVDPLKRHATVLYHKFGACSFD